MSEIIRKEHNVSTLMYHIVCPAKYRRAVISEEVDKKLREICVGIEARYEIRFLEIGTVGEHGDEKVIQQYVKNQGRNPDNYQKIHEGKQLELFPYQNKA